MADLDKLAQQIGEIGIKSRAGWRTIMGAVALVTLFWWTFLMVLAISYGLTATIIVSIVIGFRALIFIRNAARIEDALDKTSA